MNGTQTLSFLDQVIERFFINLTFKSVCEILWYYHSNDPFWQKFSKVIFANVFFGLFNPLSPNIIVTSI